MWAGGQIHWGYRHGCLGLWPLTNHLIRDTYKGKYMRTFKQYLEAVKQRRENGEAGFSLVELIVVVVILGVLAAVAIPIFNGIQAEAENNAVRAAAANAASQVTAQAALGQTLAVDNTPEFTFGVTGTTNNVESICVTATVVGSTPAKTASSGPGCVATGTP